jgi:hypothetical protein
VTLNQKAVNRPWTTSQTSEQRRKSGEGLSVSTDLPPWETKTALRALQGKHLVSLPPGVYRDAARPDKCRELIGGQHVITAQKLRHTSVPTFASGTQSILKIVVGLGWRRQGHIHKSRLDGPDFRLASRADLNDETHRLSGTPALFLRR